MSTKKRVGPAATPAAPPAARRPVSAAAAGLHSMPAAASATASGASTPMIAPSAAPSTPLPIAGPPAPTIPSGSTSPSSLFYTSLLLLGFDAPSLSRRHAPIDLGPAMFDKAGSGNPKGMQVLLHFLLLKIKQCAVADQHNAAPEWKEVTSTFQHSFPCLDRTQARDFLACALGCLIGLEKGPANVFPPGTIRKSHFAQPQGERMNVIFWHLSTYALQVTMHAVYPIPAASMPVFALPSLADGHLFPHLLKAMKAHIARQSNTYVVRVREQEAQEEEWRTTAQQLTAEAHDLQKQLNDLQPPPKPRIPGEKPSAEAEMLQQLFSPAAQTQRDVALQTIASAHTRLRALFARFQRERSVLNDVLDGVWKAKSLDRAALEKMLEENGGGGEKLAEDQQQPGQNGEQQQPQQRPPLNLAKIVTEWNDSLLKIQGVLSQYLQPPTASGSSVPSPYVTALASTSDSLATSLRAHTARLSGIRSLAQTMRGGLVPELKKELRRLQQELRDRGAYVGPVLKTTTTTIQQPTLIPPTPILSAMAPTLAVPATPAGVPGSSSRMAQVQPTPAHFAGRPSSTSSHGGASRSGHPRATLTNHASTAAPSLPSRISDSVRRAAQSRSMRDAHKRDYMAAAPPASTTSRLGTIVDEENNYSQQQLQRPGQLPSSCYSAVNRSGSVRFSPEVDAAKYYDPRHQLASPPSSHDAAVDALGDISPVVATKKLVFSPLTNQSATTSASAASTPEAHATNGSSTVGRASSVRSLGDPSSARQSFSATAANVHDTTTSSVRSHFLSPSSHPGSSSRHPRPRGLLSPSNDLASMGEGLLGADELYYHEEEPEEQQARLQQQQEQEEEAERARAQFDERTPTHGAGREDGEGADEEEEEDDEIVFSTGGGATHSRRTSASTTTSVDPNAPTPAPARRTEQRFVHHGLSSTPQATTAMSTPQYRGAKAATSRLMSPSYDFGAHAGLLDEDEED